jgi:hypothetical protein
MHFSRHFESQGLNIYWKKSSKKNVVEKRDAFVYFWSVQFFSANLGDF